MMVVAIIDEYHILAAGSNLLVVGQAWWFGGWTAAVSSLQQECDIVLSKGILTPRKE